MQRDLVVMKLILMKVAIAGKQYHYLNIRNIFRIFRLHEVSKYAPKYRLMSNYKHIPHPLQLHDDWFQSGDEIFIRLSARIPMLTNIIKLRVNTSFASLAPVGQLI